MSMTIESLGYRWKGIYSPYLAYQERDVVFKDGGAYVIRGGTPQPFALGQQDVILKGQLLTGGVSVGGNAGMVLHSNGPTGMEFRFMQERNGTIAIRLMDTLNCGAYTASSYYMMAIMNGGDVRGWGNASGGRLGCGAGDFARAKPARVAFLPGTPRIVSVKSNWLDTFYIDENGGLWHSGPNSENASGTNSPNFIPRKLNGLGDLGYTTRVVKVFTGYDYYGCQHQGCIDSNGLVYMWGLNQYGCCGWGDTNGSVYPKVVPISQRYPMKDAFVSGGTYTATYLIDTYGRLWTAGQGGSSGHNYDQTFHALFMPWGEDKPVKTIRTSETDGHWVAGAQYYRRFAVVLENGSLYMWGDDSGQTNGGWGTGYTGDIWTSSAMFPYKCLDGVLEAFTISGGYARSIALMQDGTVKATGYSGYSINGKSADTTTWQTIGAGYLEGVTKMRCYGAMYGATAMALRSDGRAVGWGCGTNGAVGNGQGASSNLPNSFVMLDRKIVDFSSSGYCSAGDDIVMAHHFLTTDGRVYTTGAASNYMNGDPLGNPRNTPSQIIFLKDIEMGTVSLGKIAFSYKGSYSGASTYFRQDVVTFNGDSYVCLVDNTLGVSPLNNLTKWQLFAQGTAGVSSSAGELVYNSGGALAALAPGAAGQVLTVGANGLPAWGTPDVRSGTKVKRLLDNASGKVNNRPYRKFGAIMTDNSVRMWGNNDNYVLGDGNTFARPYPVRVGFAPGFAGAAKVYVDYNYAAYCIDLNGQLWSWGYNGYGQLGLNDIIDRRVPVNASLVTSSSIFGKTVIDVIVAGGVEGYCSVMALCADGTLHATGYNGYGQLGLGDTTQRNQFVQVPVLSNVVAARLGRERYTAAYAVQADGKFYAWGYNGDGQLGDGATAQANIPVQRTGGTLAGKSIVNVYCGHTAAYALDNTGRLHAWGTNTTYGNLGCGNFANQFTPVQVAIGVSEVYTNSYDYPMVLIRKTDGSLWGAGAGNYSANGNVAGNHAADFAQIPIGNTVVKATIGGTGSYNYCLALLQNGTVYAWGYNGNGALAVGDNTNRTTPALVPIALRTVTDIAVYGTSSEQCSAFLLDDGQLCVAGYGGSYANTDNNSNWIGTPYPVIL